MRSVLSCCLGVDYIFWCTEEPYYSEQLIPFMKR